MRKKNTKVISRMIHSTNDLQANNLVKEISEVFLSTHSIALFKCLE